MKKILGLLTSFLALFLIVTGCSCDKDKNDNKVALLYGDRDATTYKSIEANALNSKLERKETFLLYYFDPTCGGCKAFFPYLNSVIDEKDLLVYAIDAAQLSSNHQLKRADYSTPTLLLYEEGKLKQAFQSTNEKYSSYFTSKEGFEKFLTDNVYLPTMYYVSVDTLASMVSNNEKFIIYFGNSNCGDCRRIEGASLNNYLKTHTNSKKMYIVDRSANTFVGDEWVNFKNTYGLSKEGSNEFGFRVGYTPTFQYREGNQIKAAVVLYNTYEDGVTVEPYFSDDVPAGTAYATPNDYNNDRTSFYAAKLEAFLDNNLSKVD